MGSEGEGGAGWLEEPALRTRGWRRLRTRWGILWYFLVVTAGGTTGGDQPEEGQPTRGPWGLSTWASWAGWQAGGAVEGVPGAVAWAWRRAGLESGLRFRSPSLDCDSYPHALAVSSRASWDM